MKVGKHPGIRDHVFKELPPRFPMDPLSVARGRISRLSPFAPERRHSIRFAIDKERFNLLLVGHTHIGSELLAD